MTEPAAKAYPMWLERMGVLILISLAIVGGREVLGMEDVPDAVGWLTSICLLPLLVLFMSEAWGRFLQKP